MERTEKLRINQNESRIRAALEMADAFITRQGLSGKKALHLRLLTEETLGMVRAMTHDFKGTFWIEQEDGVCRIRLAAETEMDKDKKDDLLSVSKSGTNAAVKGIMNKISDFFENGVLYFNDVMKLEPVVYSDDQQFMDYVSMGYCMPSDLASDMPQMMQAQMIWSLNHYRQSLEKIDGQETIVQDAWDELEKSIVASLSDDVIVGVKKDQVDLTIIASK